MVGYLNHQKDYLEDDWLVVELVNILQDTVNLHQELDIVKA